MNSRIQLYRPVQRRDAMNAVVSDFAADSGKISAHREDVSDAQRLQAQQAGSAITARFQVRRSRRTDQVDPTWQLSDGAERFQVTGRKRLLAHGDYGAHEGYEFTCIAQAETVAPIDDNLVRG